MKRTVAALALAFAIAAPLAAQSPATHHHEQGSTWASAWRALIHIIASPFRLYDDGGGHTIPIIAPTQNPGS